MRAQILLVTMSLVIDPEWVIPAPIGIHNACTSSLTPPLRVVQGGSVKAGSEIRTRHDELGKRALSLWLRALGDVQIDARVAGESRRGDVLYQERRQRPSYRRRLGVLGELARGRVLFEPFRNPLTTLELKGCVLKSIDLVAQEVRAARRAKKPLSSVTEPSLCAITPTLSSELAVEAGAQPMPGGLAGFYVLAPMWRTVIVVAHELPSERSTLWLRLFGRGKVQAAAVRELEEMSEREPLRDATLRLLFGWLQRLQGPGQPSEDELELKMNLEHAYERWEQKVKAKSHREGKAEGKAEGRAEGKAEGKAEAVLVVLVARGIEITAAQRERVLACTDARQVDAWLRAASTTPSVAALLSDAAPPRHRARRTK